jgi:hypothetical protein
VRGDNEIGNLVLRSSDAPDEHMNKDGEPFHSTSAQDSLVVPPHPIFMSSVSSVVKGFLC